MAKIGETVYSFRFGVCSFWQLAAELHGIGCCVTHLYILTLYRL